MKKPEDLGQKYLEKLAGLLQKIGETQMPAIEQAACAVANAIASGNIVHVFGVGHSHILAEEAFFRAGGLAPVNAILEPSLMLHEGALKSTQLENITGLAEVLLDYYEVQADDVLIVASNSGVNAVPVEMATLAKKRGVFTVAITSLSYSRMVKGQRKALFEVVDLVIDNLGEPGDAALDLPGVAQRVGPTSTVAGAAIINAIMIKATHLLQELGIEPPIYVSSHMPGAAEHNMRLMQRYRGRIKLL
ncbi:MAG: SIS domain-containing protein [Candidatus Bipolaricaulota bacterium]|nr:SIS domain-containing protein [Candidatus Bipolaricaulota bacterium]MDW8127194.1 SIS domain-containing protein [Candidatus Bipolaricaulota bacterium]